MDDFPYIPFLFNQMNSITNISIKQLLRAATLKEKIRSLEKQLSKIFVSTETAKSSVPKKRKYRQLQRRDGKRQRQKAGKSCK